MQKLLTQSLTRWTCLLVYVFVTTHLSGAMVLCHGSDGHVEVELAFQSCPASATHGSSSATLHESHPTCDDTVLSSGPLENPPNRQDRVAGPRSSGPGVCPRIAWGDHPPASLSGGLTPPPIRGPGMTVSLRSVILLI